MRIKSIKVKKSELLYFTAYFLFIFAGTTISNSYLFGTSSYRHEITNICNYISTILFVASFVMQKMEIKVVLKKLVTAAVAFLVSANTHSIGFGVSIMAVISAVNIDIKKIIKCCIYTNIFCLLIVVIPALLGMIPNEVRIHNGLEAQSLGFAYYSNAPYILLMVTILLFLLAKNKKQENIIILFATPIQYLIYKTNTVRLVLYIYILFVILVFLFRFLNKNVKHNIINFLSLIMFPAATVFTVFASLNVNKYVFLTKLNDLLNSRLGFNNIGFQRYGVSLFGNKIETNSGFIDENFYNHYFYIDSGYAYALLSYGLLISILLIVLWSVLSHHAAKKNDFKLLIVCIVNCVFSFVNNLLFNISLNPILIMALNLLLSRNKEEVRGVDYKLSKLA